MNIVRSCGECTVCCKTHGVRELNKPSGKWCEHCKIGEGCSIYAERPKECGEFKCAWLLGIKGGSLHQRPDRTKVVPDYREIPGIGTVMWFGKLRINPFALSL